MLDRQTEHQNLKCSASSPHQEAPLSSVFSQYLSRLPAGARRSVRFHFDGSKVAGSQTAAQLELEDGDIIERIKQTGFV
uniref:Rad60/SUMO-like domain-containing protein n=1 Tax=Poecilia reticulata TaxID=8081 RepID=A0A3P9P6M1_POERE